MCEKRKYYEIISFANHVWENAFKDHIDCKTIKDNRGNRSSFVSET